MKSRIVRFTAKVMICVMGYQVIIPATSLFALTSGPSQPEVQSFEPVGTTEMVDLFSGDFVYNIPLMDVEGYPINISYHSGITIEQEASWVGLGWNINPGEINRGVRGLPDDFNGDTLNKYLKVKPEKNYSLRLGANAGFEVVGALGIGVDVGQTISYNNYKGIGIGFDVGAAFTTPVASVGIGMDVGSLDGASVNGSLGFKTANAESSGSGNISLNGSTGFNTRSGMKAISFGINAGLPVGYNSTIPIGLQNYVSVVTNPTTLSAFSIQVKLGLEAMFMYPHFSTTVTGSKFTHVSNGSLPAYGYLFSQNAPDNAIMDFSREKDGIYNNTLNNLPLSSMTYDVYGISGQGTGGTFRAVRSDIGSINDPLVTGSSNSNSFGLELGVGIGIGGLFELGTDATFYRSKVESGGWYKKNFRGNQKKSLFENVYFKQGGELTYNVQQDAANIASHAPVYLDGSGQMKSGSGTSLGQVPSTYSEVENRSARSNYLSMKKNSEALNDSIENYPRGSFLNINSTIKRRGRTGTVLNRAKGHHVAEMTQVLSDGRRYVYGLPAMNNLQKEATFSVDESQRNIGSGLVKYTGTQESPSNVSGRENYFQATYTPAFAHSYLLTAVLSSDYADVSGDGPTEDDPGNYTKFNYSLSDSDYRWIAPYQAGTDSAQYQPGFWSDNKDDKGQYVMGSKEMWYMHSVETKNFIAEFYTSPRNDGLGTKKPAATYNSFPDYGYANVDDYLTSTKTANSLSYKLDSIKLFNKNDRFINQANATPIKTVIFAYDYSQCPGVPNHLTPGAAGQNGKLTLKRIYFRYGKSDKSLMNPYVFKYDETSTNNKPYSFSDKDRWGNYKANNAALTNYEFPYVNQNKTEANTNSSNWHLREIKLPSGGRLKIEFEADDYSYVQDKRTMEMFPIAGVGSSSNYEPKDLLYEDIDKPYDYVYFKRDTTREISGKTLRENYLDGSDLLYFSFNLDIAARNKYEHIKGYAKVESMGVCNNAAYGYIKVKRESAGGSSGKYLNPITLAGLNTGRYYLPHIIYPGYNEGDPGDMEVLNGLVAATKEMFSLFQNANVRFVEGGLSKKFNIPKSWIRLNTPGYTKIGGGSRVKQLLLEDSWNEMTSNGGESSFGRTYDYTTLLDNNKVISSGVASYEPLIGGDEIPQRRPVDYKAESGKLMPAIELYQEEPFGESFYPSASVGYSKVTVRSINRDVARSSKAEDIHEFYTAKDFPIETEFTPKSTPVKTKHRTLTNKKEEQQVLQGYVLRMNDMHGKPKTISNYVIKPDNISRELITSTKYNYQVDSRGKLNNTVKAVKRDHLVNPVYAVQDMTLGEEVDFTIDSRRREMESSSMTLAFNLNVVNFLFVVVPVPTVFFPDMKEQSLFQTMVATKVVQQYGVLKSIEVTDHGAKTVSENILYDSETGQVLLTKVNNEFDDPIHNLNYPAYWAYDDMGPSYYNVGYEEHFDSAMVDNCTRGRLLHPSNVKHFNPGDELLMSYRQVSAFGDISEVITRKMFVVGAAPLNTLLDCDNPPGTPNLYPCTIIFEPAAKNEAGAPTFYWAMGGTKLIDIDVKVVRSGRRNMLGNSIQQLTINGNFPVSSFSDLFNSSALGNATAGSSNLLASNVTTFKEDGLNQEFTSSGLSGTYRHSQYIRGEKGSWREWASYGWGGPRNYSLDHTRRDGVFKTYQPFWIQGTNPADPATCKMADYVLYAGTNPGWRKLKEVTAYNAYGLPVEALDASLIPSTAVYAFNYSQPIAVAQNARNKQVNSLSFEDLLQIFNENKRKYGIWPSLKPEFISWGTPANPASLDYTYNYGKQYLLPKNSDYVENAIVDATQSHSGRYSLKFNGTGNVRLAGVTDFAGVPYCYISLWVKRTGSAPVANNVQVYATGKTPAGAPISELFNAFTIKTGSVDGWYKYEGRVTMSLLQAYSDIHIQAQSGYALDDIRIMPDGANMKSFVYDAFNSRLLAELDENNFATFYEYDQEGVLVRVKKESERGILTVNEHRKANAKHVQ